MKPTVKRYPTGHWVVTCGACDDGFASLFHPWVKASSWGAAMALARWHAGLHVAQRCPTCLHEPPLPRPEVMKGDRTLFTFDGKLYRLTSRGAVVEMTEAAR